MVILTIGLWASAACANSWYLMRPTTKDVCQTNPWEHPTKWRILATTKDLESCEQQGDIDWEIGRVLAISDHSPGHATTYYDVGSMHPEVSDILMSETCVASDDPRLAR